ncbi:hypothetical protein [Comamonas sp.]|uniref:hypothetical protein n=1 Tax=Comamonas sp. TaxID=34028 RepID=UPI00289A1C06|nr:hypothetical protein [Comamonas sp.]
MDPFKLVGWQDHASSRGDAAGFAAQDERLSPQHAVVPPGKDKHRNGCVALASTAVTLSRSYRPPLHKAPRRAENQFFKSAPHPPFR